jgi:transcriptional regulator with XRE-family HTH domain
MNHRRDEYAVIRDGAALREKRQKAGLTLREVARVAGLQSHTFLIALEKGRRLTCTADTAYGIAIALRLSPLELRDMFEFRASSRVA